MSNGYLHLETAVQLIQDHSQDSARANRIEDLEERRSFVDSALNGWLQQAHFELMSANLYIKDGEDFRTLQSWRSAANNVQGHLLASMRNHPTVGGDYLGRAIAACGSP